MAAITSYELTHYWISRVSLRPIFVLVAGARRAAFLTISRRPRGHMFPQGEGVRRFQRLVFEIVRCLRVELER